MGRASVVSKIVHETFLYNPSIMPDSPWWRYLESNFHDRPEGFELEIEDRARVMLTASTDIFIRTAGSALLSALAMPVGYNPLRARHVHEEKEFYGSRAESGDPKAFFEEPPPGVPVNSQVVHNPYLGPKRGVWERLTFESPFVPVNPRVRDAYRKHVANRTALAYYWRHKEGPRPTICAIHGYFFDPFWFNEWYLTLPFFYRMGCDVLLFTLPFHGPRQGRFSPFSGYKFFAGGLARVNEAFAQAVYDFRIFLNYLEEKRGVSQLGVTGISLGGYTAALLASVEKRLTFCIPNVPVVSIPDLVLEYFPLSLTVRALLMSLGWSIKDLRHLLAVHSPLTYKPLIAPERLMIVGGVGDRLAPPKHSRLLWDHWGRCRIHWFPGSHLLHLDKGEYLSEIMKFLRGISDSLKGSQSPHTSNG